MEDVVIEPPVPEILHVLRETRRFGVPFYNGALWDWPYLFRLEINSAVDGELEYAQIVYTNNRLKEKVKSKNENST